MLLAYIQNQTQSRNDSNENWVNSEANKMNFETIGSALLLQQRSSNFGGYFSITIFLLFASLASRRFYFCKMCRRDCFMSDVRDLYQLKLLFVRKLFVGEIFIWSSNLISDAMNKWTPRYSIMKTPATFRRHHRQTRLSQHSQFASTIRIHSPKTFRCCSCFSFDHFLLALCDEDFYFCFVNSKTATADRAWREWERDGGKGRKMCNIWFTSELLIF